MAEAPKWFLNELRVFDPDLRVRWSRRTETFHLERRVTRSLHPGTIRNDQWHDDYIRAQDGYVLVGIIRPGLFSRTIFDKLRAADLWSNGGWARVCRKIEEFEEAEEERKWDKFGEALREESAELYETMKIRDGRSVFNAGWGV
ncbi:MAG TPA: hypothetical protein DGH68_04295 [Bacteroidetes bacterium]|jgi:hypothetical protein|nr:hypothetical protein [Bacteroidota bacterium]